jgi:hypothetical protein
MGEADDRKCLIGWQRRPAQHRLPEGELLNGRERRLQRIAMPDIMAKLGKRRILWRGIEPNPARQHGKQPGDDTQKRRFASTVRPDNGQGLSGSGLEGEAVEDHP